MKKDLYRRRINKSLNEKVLNFISSLKDDLWIAEEDIIGTQVHNIMLYEQKILNKTEIRKILLSLKKIKQKIKNNLLELNSEFEDIHPLIESLVIDDIGINIGGKIHTGRSRNDQVSVDIRLKIRKELNILTQELFNLIDSIVHLSEQSIDAYMPLYTHQQKAQLGCFAHYTNNYTAQILRGINIIDEIYKRINKNPLGACAVGGTSINIDRERTSELLGFDGLIYNSLDAVSSRDYIYEILSFLSLLGLHFSRIAEDLIIWSTQEYDYIELDDEFCSVSSVMPQKKNPDSIELIRSKSSVLISNLSKASIIIKAIPSGYFRDFQELKPILRESFIITHSIIEVLNGVFSTIRLNKVNMISEVRDSFILALDLAEHLVEKYEIPFRKSHEIVAVLVKESKNPQQFFNKNRINELILKITNKNIEISDDFIEEMNNIQLCLQKRISKGSPSENEINEHILILKKQKGLSYEKYLSRLERIDKSKGIRNKLIQELIN
ncbi:MAG: argininosuccinate lyase [Promethearchaeati archaeon]